MIKTILSQIILFYKLILVAIPDKRFSLFLLIADQLSWIKLEKSVNRMYFPFASKWGQKETANLIGRNELTRLERQFTKSYEHQYMNKVVYEACSKDKIINSIILKALGFPVVPIVSLVVEGVCYSFPEMKISSFDRLLTPGKRFYLKSPVLEFGKGVFKIEKDASCCAEEVKVNGVVTTLAALREMTSSAFWLIQEEIQPHHKLRLLNHNSLSTVRIVTLKTQGGIIHLGGFISLADKPLMDERWGDGAVYIGYDLEDGCLHEFGYKNPSLESSQLVSKLSTGDLLFKNFEVPFLHDAVDLCLAAHKMFPYLFLIGWDVAITDSGPLILETNERPGMMAMQLINGGKRSVVYNSLFSRGEVNDVSKRV